MNLTFRTNKEITACQVADCLATLSALMGWMTNEDQPVEGNVQTSLEGTAIRVLNRLDTIFDNERHWKLPTVDAHYFGVRHMELGHEEMEQKLKYQEFLRQKALVGILAPERDSQVLDVEATPIKPRRKKKGSK